MERVFHIEDDLHDERQDGEFSSFEAALARVRELAAVPWGTEPNLAPCKNWMNCGRHYFIVEEGAGAGGTSVVKVMKDGATWSQKVFESGDGDAG